jgi:hypothetical protein
LSHATSVPVKSVNRSIARTTRTWSGAMNIKEEGKSQKADPRSADLGPVNLLPSAF